MRTEMWKIAYFPSNTNSIYVLWLLLLEIISNEPIEEEEEEKTDTQEKKLN